MDDSLEELRRMIQRTRGKMDSEMKVMDGFLADVSHIKGMQRNFDEPLAALPSSQSQPALKAPERVKALQTSSSAVALGDSRKLPKRSGPSLLPLITRSQPLPWGLRRQCWPCVQQNPSCSQRGVRLPNGTAPR